MISDGECREGTTWESLLIASKHKLDNLVIIVDYNKKKALSKLNDALPLDNLSKNLNLLIVIVLKLKMDIVLHQFINHLKKLKKTINQIFL